MPLEVNCRDNARLRGQVPSKICTRCFTSGRKHTRFAPRLPRIRRLECAPLAGLGRGGLEAASLWSSGKPPEGLYFFSGPFATPGRVGSSCPWQRAPAQRVVSGMGLTGPFLFVATVSCDGVGLARAADRPHRAAPHGAGVRAGGARIRSSRGSALLRIYIDRPQAANDERSGAAGRERHASRWMATAGSREGMRQDCGKAASASMTASG